MTMMAHDIQCVALQRLETALRLYFEHEDYYSVITLAGASEEIFGKLLTAAGGDNALDRSKNNFNKSYETLYPGAPDDEKSIADRQKWIADRQNDARNKLKHWTPGQPKVVQFDAKDEAKDMLIRAIDNYFRLTGNYTDAMRQFDQETWSLPPAVRDTPSPPKGSEM